MNVSENRLDGPYDEAAHGIELDLAGLALGMSLNDGTVRPESRTSDLGHPALPQVDLGGHGDLICPSVPAGRAPSVLVELGIELRRGCDNVLFTFDQLSDHGGVHRCEGLLVPHVSQLSTERQR